MSVKTMDVFTCNACGQKDFGIDGGYDVPLDWLTIRMSKNITATTADDLHICPSCKYTDLVDLWETI